MCGHGWSWLAMGAIMSTMTAVMTGHGRPWSTTDPAMADHGPGHDWSWSTMTPAMIGHGRPWPVITACPTNVYHSNGEGANKHRTMRLWKNADEFFPKPPFSLCVSSRACYVRQKIVSKNCPRVCLKPHHLILSATLRYSSAGHLERPEPHCSMMACEPCYV